MMEKALGQAVCLGVHKGDPRDAWRTLCHTSRMCPSCEQRKATRRANGIRKRLEVWDFLTEGDFTVGVLTTTLPGKHHWVRHGSLRQQYEYMTERRQDTHSMRGLNYALKKLGAEGGTHFLEFTWSKKNGWWNLHNHTLFWGYGHLDGIEATDRHVESEDYLGPRLLLKKEVKGLENRFFRRLGLGGRYSLDYAEGHELEMLMQYSSKVAYATKPFKAPKEKELEIRNFLIGLDGKMPRLSRPFGDAVKSIITLPD